MILLDTNALLWLEAGHRRARPLRGSSSRLFVSPATLLEVQFLVELGRIRWRGAVAALDLVDDERWRVDEPSSIRWFSEAASLSWTHDPFDRLIVAHALTRNWKLATADSQILEHLEPGKTISL